MPQHTHALQTGGFLPQFRSTVLVSAGSNQFSSAGSPTETLAHALNLLSGEGWVIRASSRFFQTPCFPAGAGPDFVNAAFRLDFYGSAALALESLHKIEARLGRRRMARWGQRTLDLDLVACGQQVRPDRDTVQRWIDLPLSDQMRATPGDLVLPHPRIQDRAFVLVPLLDIAPQWVHPLLAKSVRQMLDDLPARDRDSVKPLVFRHKHQ